jgi:hypothetical protein
LCEEEQSCVFEDRGMKIVGVLLFWILPTAGCRLFF